jgi:signal transduction histidine kinase
VSRSLFWRVWLHGVVLLAAVFSLLLIGGAVFEHRVRTGMPLPRLIHFGLVMATMLALLTLVSIPLARQLTAPLERLARAVERFGGGDLTARTAIDRSDEVGRLARAFDDMAGRIERMVRSEKEFLANVSHELRTPLARVRVALEIAQEGDDAKAREQLVGIAEDLAELERLVADVLTTARLDLASGQPGIEAAMRKAPLAGEALVSSAETRFRTVHADRRLSVEASGPLPTIEADPALLRRAIDNLLDNACAYSDADKPVVLAAYADGDALVIEVKDQGVGISPDDHARLFTPFFRADRSRDRHTGGFGLGLALTKRIVEATGGTLEVESEVGAGTTIRVRLRH